MYRGFNLKLDNYNFLDNYDPQRKNNYNFITEKYKFETKLAKIKKKPQVLLENSQDGTKIQDNWFPKIEADVFISHSHKDKKLAKKLAYWLEDIFQLNTFIDSDIWGYGDDLIKILDDKYADNHNGTYSYHIRNQTTSHVHMMLTTALTDIITNSKVFFFLNTPNSILDNSTKYGDDKEKTYSPWIYHEINVTRMISELRKENLMENTNESEVMSISYNASLNHLSLISSLSSKSLNYLYEILRLK